VTGLPHITRIATLLAKSQNHTLRMHCLRLTLSDMDFQTVQRAYQDASIFKADLPTLVACLHAVRGERAAQRDAPPWLPFRIYI
jgi:hypothetical protein